MKLIRFFLLGIILKLLLSGCSVTDPAPLYPIPSEKQLQWHEMEKYAFVHFSINTFTGKEWGYGDESPELFNPADFNAEQIVNTIKKAGLSGLILTCKHHDGFCLWPSKYTEHSIKNSPYKDGKGDIVREISDACHKAGIRFGVYISPWDRNHSKYGKEDYIIYYRNQIKELLENYGEIFEIWFDGANGGNGYYGGERSTRKIDAETYYDWETTVAMIHKISPGTLVWQSSVPEARWCGNEDGYMDDPNWCAIKEDGTNWVPAEVDVSARPGWFYHETEKIRSVENLFEIYLNSIGHGATLLLNIPPNKCGQIDKEDAEELFRWRKMIDDIFSNDLAQKASIKASNTRSRKFRIENIIKKNNTADGEINKHSTANKKGYWATEDSVKSAYIDFNWKSPVTIKYIIIQENISLGQRVRGVEIDAIRYTPDKSVHNGTTNITAVKEDQMGKIGECTTVGYKRIIKVDNITTSSLRIKFTDSKGPLAISNIEIY